MVCTRHLGPPQVMFGANLPCPCRQIVVLLPLRGPPCLLLHTLCSCHPHGAILVFLLQVVVLLLLNAPPKPLSSLIAPLHPCRPLLDQGVTLVFLPCRLWSCFPYMRPLATITHETIQYGIDKDGASVHDVIGSRWGERFMRPHLDAALMTHRMCQYKG
jgi:hypothetical protein